MRILANVVSSEAAGGIFVCGSYDAQVTSYRNFPAVSHLVARLSLLACLGFTGCTGAILTPLTPARGLTRSDDISFGNFPRQKLDVYRPHHVAALAPVVIFFYGGWWSTGDKNDYAFVAQAFTSRGFVVVIPNYRLFPSIKFPAFVDDGALAVKWAHDHITDFGGDPNRIYLTGHSAGGHIALLLAYDDHYLRDVGVDPKIIRAVAPMSAPTDFMPIEDQRFNWGMKFDQLQPDPTIEPTHFVSATVPPTLIIQGLKDTTVWPDQAEKLFARLCEVGATSTLIEYPTLDHVGVVLSLAYPFRWQATITDEVAQYFHDHK